MTEEEAIEYLVMKDIPRRVWDTPPGSNIQNSVICSQEPDAVNALATHGD